MSDHAGAFTAAGEDLAGLLTASTVHLDVPGGGGTGFFVAPGWVLTCAHVVARSGGDVFVRGQAGEATGRVVAQHPRNPPASEGPYPFPDLAVIQAPGWVDGQPCAWLGETLPVLDGRLSARGYTTTWDRNRPSSEPALFSFEGLHEVDGGHLLKLAAGEAVPGMSGGPLLDLASGRVCGMVKTTRDPRAPRGGWAVPTRVLHGLHPNIWAAHDHFHKHDRRWREVAEGWSKLARLLLEPPLPRPAKESAAYLLGAEFEVVPFRGREQLLDQLERWCQEPGGLGVRLITGPGGEGKSRLARQLAARMTSRGWLAGLSQAELSDTALGWLRATSTPTLLAIDYAEGRAGQVARLVDALLGADRAGPVRLLLLARSAGDWWAELRASTRRLEYALEGTVEMGLSSLEDTLAGRQQACADAFMAFAEQLGRAPPAGAVVDLTDSRYGSVLQLHMAALAGLLPLAAPDSGEGPGLIGDPIARLLNHERRYWQRAAQAAGLTYDWVELARAVAALTLCGANDEAQAAGLLERMPGLPHTGQSARLARLVRRLYPSRAGYWGGLQPDLLGEELVAQVTMDPVVAGGPPGLLEALLAEGSEEQTHRALTVLARAAPRHAHLHGALGPLLRTDPERLVLPALAVAIQARDPRPLVAALRGVLELLAHSPLVVELVDRLPEHSVALGELAVDATHRALDFYCGQTEPDPAKVVTALNRLSVRLSTVGRREDALRAIEEAVAIGREQAAADPAFVPALATPLLNLSNLLSDVGRRDEALRASEEAVEYYRQLADASPMTFLPDLAMSLHNLSSRLSDVGRRDEALRASEEAVGYFRQLAETTPDAFLPNLAMSLSNLGVHLSRMDRWEDALRPSEEAVGYYRQLAEAAPDAFLPHLAMSLSGLSNRLGQISRWEDALRASEEAVAIRRRLAEAAPNAFLPNLAKSLAVMSNWLGQVGRLEDALGASEEAVGHYRQLAEAAPDAFVPDLAKALNNLALQLSDAGRQDDALRASAEAVGYFLRLAEAAPNAFLSDLAVSLEVLRRLHES